MNIKLIRLITGENIIASVESEVSELIDHSVTVLEPRVVEKVKLELDGTFVESYIMKPWLILSEDNYVEIQSDKIVYITNLNSKFIDQYLSYVGGEEQTDEESDDFTNYEYDDEEINENHNENRILH